MTSVVTASIVTRKTGLSCGVAGRAGVLGACADRPTARTDHPHGGPEAAMFQKHNGVIMPRSGGSAATEADSSGTRSRSGVRQASARRRRAPATAPAAPLHGVGASAGMLTKPLSASDALAHCRRRRRCPARRRRRPPRRRRLLRAPVHLRTRRPPHRLPRAASSGRFRAGCASSRLGDLVRLDRDSSRFLDLARLPGRSLDAAPFAPVFRFGRRHRRLEEFRPIEGARTDTGPRASARTTSSNASRPTLMPGGVRIPIEDARRRAALGGGVDQVGVLVAAPVTGETDERHGLFSLLRRGRLLRRALLRTSSWPSAPDACGCGRGACGAAGRGLAGRWRPGGCGRGGGAVRPALGCDGRW